MLALLLALSWAGLLILLFGVWIVVILIRGLVLLYDWFVEEFIVGPREERRIQELQRAKRRQAASTPQPVNPSLPVAPTEPPADRAGV